MTRGRGVRNVARASRGVTLDTGALIALERRKAGALALLRACRFARARITIPAPVVAEWWRGQHAGLLAIGTLEPLMPEIAKHAGELLARTGRANAIDACVIASAALRGDLVVTSDPIDLRELARLCKGVSVEAIG